MDSRLISFILENNRAAMLSSTRRGPESAWVVRPNDGEPYESLRVVTPPAILARRPLDDVTHSVPATPKLIRDIALERSARRAAYQLVFDRRAHSGAGERVLRPKLHAACRPVFRRSTCLGL